MTRPTLTTSPPTTSTARTGTTAPTTGTAPDTGPADRTQPGARTATKPPPVPAPPAPGTGQDAPAAVGGGPEGQAAALTTPGPTAAGVRTRTGPPAGAVPAASGAGPAGRATAAVITPGAGPGSGPDAPAVVAGGAVVSPPVRRGPPHTPAPRPVAVAVGVAVAAGVLVGGGLVGGALRGFLDRMAGVVALVALSLAVMVGLATALRGLLPPRARTAAQHLHRALGVLGVGFLLLHIGVKVAGGRVAAGAAALGWGSGDALVGLGTLACYLFLLAVATGVWRGVFATRRWIRPFRVLHGASYAGWLAAVVHGLTAGRAPAPWVVASYALCLTATAATLAVRHLRNRSA